MNYSAFLIVSTLMIFLLIGFILRPKSQANRVEFLPSICWTVFCIIPMAIQFEWFSPQYVTIQSFAMTIFTVLIFSADILASFGLGNTKEKRPLGVDRGNETTLIVLAIVCIVISQGIHLALMPKIPLLEKLKGKESTQPALLFFDKFERSWQETFGQIGVVSNGVLEPGSVSLTRLQDHAPLASTQSKDWQQYSSEFLTSNFAAGVQDKEIRKILVDCQSRIHDHWQGVSVSTDTALRLRETVQAIPLSRDFENLFKAGQDTLTSCKHEIESVYLAVARENSSKLLHVPLLFIYFVQATLILTPAVVFMVARYWGLRFAVGLALFSIFYSRATLAKGPLYLMALTYCVLGWRLVPAYAKKWAWRGVGFVGGIAAVYAIYFYATHPLSVFNFRAPISYQQEVLAQTASGKATSDLTFTLTDHYRSQSSDNWFYRPDSQGVALSSAQNYLNFLAYRMWLAPVEVSHRWYAYFPKVSQGFIGFYGFDLRSRSSPTFKHPANQVALWSYVKMYPRRYLESANAYSSVDADAYARFGMKGVICVGLLVFALRLALILLRKKSFFEECLYYTSIVTLSVSLPASSLQAILGAQGLMAIISIGAAIAIVRSFLQRRKRQTLLLDSI